MLYRTDTYIGFYAAVVENISIGLIYTFYIFAYILFYIGLCSCCEAFVCDLTYSVFHLNEDVEQKQRKNLKDILELHYDMLR